MTILLFLTIAFLALLAAVGVIALRNPVHAVLCLVFCFFQSALLWLMLEAEFLALILVLVYVGAVMVLFLFVVMMLNIHFAKLREGFVRYLPAGLLVGLLLAVEMITALVHGPLFAQPATAVPSGSQTLRLGLTLYQDYLPQIELAGAILLVAIIAAIALTLQKRGSTRHQDPALQVRVRKADRLRLIRDQDKPS